MTMRHIKGLTKDHIEILADAQRNAAYEQLLIAIKRQMDHEPRCDCGHLFEICNCPNCPNGAD